jgi:hypothetical protein
LSCKNCPENSNDTLERRAFSAYAPRACSIQLSIDVLAVADAQYEHVLV